MSKVWILEGRLVVARFPCVVDVAYARSVAAEMRALIVRLEAQRFVSLGDLSATTQLDEDAGEALLRMLRADNAQLERSAVLIHRSSVSGLRVWDLVRRAWSLDRRAFMSEEREHALRWIAEVLSEAEVQAARAFLRERPSVAR